MKVKCGERFRKKKVFWEVWDKMLLRFGVSIEDKWVEGSEDKFLLVLGII